MAPVGIAQREVPWVGVLRVRSAKQTPSPQLWHKEWSQLQMFCRPWHNAVLVMIGPVFSALGCREFTGLLSRKINSAAALLNWKSQKAALANYFLWLKRIYYQTKRVLETLENNTSYKLPAIGVWERVWKCRSPLDNISREWFCIFAVKVFHQPLKFTSKFVYCYFVLQGHLNKFSLW